MTALPKEQRRIDHRELTVWGASARLVAWGRTSPLYGRLAESQRLFKGFKDFDDAVFLALGAPTLSERLARGERVIQATWEVYPELGPPPFVDLLKEFQFDRAFYPDYRDHVTHQVKVLLLGLSVFEGVDALRRSLLSEIGGGEAESGDEFLRRWVAAAVGHDVGYVLETEGLRRGLPGGPSEGLPQGRHEGVAGDPAGGLPGARGHPWEPVRGRLNEILATPLCRLASFRESLSPALEASIRDARRIFHPEIQAPEDLERDDSTDLLALLELEALRARLGPAEFPSAPTLLGRYYHYALTHAPQGRRQFRDHGIAGALLLLRVWRHFARYVEEMARDPIDQRLADAAPELRRLNRRLPAARETVGAAAAAIALHNINKDIWPDEGHVACGLTLKQFELDCAWPAREAGRRTPLAFLLGLVDTLQDWDRPQFRAPRSPDDVGLGDQDMSLEVRDGRVWLYFPEDAERYKNPAGEPESRYGRALRALKAYLNPRRIEGLVGWREPGVAEGKGGEGAPAPQALRVFMSFSLKDRPLAERLAAALRAQEGLEVRSEAWEARPGEPADPSLEAALAEADALLLVLSAESVRSPAAKQEVDAWLSLQPSDERQAGEEPCPPPGWVLVARAEGCSLPPALRGLPQVAVRQARFDEDVARLARPLRGEGVPETERAFGAIPEEHVAPSPGARPGPQGIPPRLQVFALLKRLLHSQFQEVVFLYDNDGTVQPYLPAGGSLVEQAIALIKLAAQREGDEVPRLLETTRQVYLGRAS